MTPFKEKPVLSELHPYPATTPSAKQLKRTHGHSTMEKQSPVRKRPLVIRSDIGNNEDQEQSHNDSGPRGKFGHADHSNDRAKDQPRSQTKTKNFTQEKIQSKHSSNDQYRNKSQDSKKETRRSKKSQSKDLYRQSLKKKEHRHGEGRGLHARDPAIDQPRDEKADLGLREGAPIALFPDDFLRKVHVNMPCCWCWAPCRE